MVGTKPEHWRIITPIFGVLACFSGIGSTLISWSVQHTVESFDKHLDKIDAKFESQEVKNTNFEHRITLVQGQCCKRSLTQIPDDGG